MIKNPETGRLIKVGGNLHLKLISDGKLQRETMDLNKVSIYNNSRQKMPNLIIEFNKKSTHWLNFSEIVKCLKCSEYELIDFLRKDFDTMKILINKKEIILIFLGREIFLKDVINEFIKDYTTENEIDWNQ